MSKKRLRLEILEKMATLATAGFGLVAALAWNSAIQDLFKKVNVFGAPDGIIVKFAYAVLITIIVVLVTVGIGRAINRLKEQLGIRPPEESDQGKK
ncbi:MAG: DUF5654 family protein [Patescibacteria group bacterium]|nr:DUF5654 family protein [bacterium]MDZ4221852.1 DUF5654 family protein [Patescibacteria group bacterium]